MGTTAGAGGTWAPPQERAARGRRRRSGRHKGAAAEAGGTWVPLQKRAARAAAAGSGGTGAPPQESQKRAVQGRRH